MGNISCVNNYCTNDICDFQKSDQNQKRFDNIHIDTLINGNYKTLTNK